MFKAQTEIKAQTEDDRLLSLCKYDRQERKSALTYRLKHPVIGYKQFPHTVESTAESPLVDKRR